MTDILDAAQTQPPPDPTVPVPPPPPVPPEPPAEPIPQPPIPPPSTDNFVVPPPKPPEPPVPSKSEAPPKEDQPKNKRINPKVLIAGLIILFISLPLIGLAIKNTLEIRSQAGAPKAELAHDQTPVDKEKLAVIEKVVKDAKDKDPTANAVDIAKENQQKIDTATNILRNETITDLNKQAADAVAKAETIKKAGCETAACFDGNEPVPVDPVRLAVVDHLMTDLNLSIAEIRTIAMQDKINAAEAILKQQGNTTPSPQQVIDALTKASIPDQNVPLPTSINGNHPLTVTFDCGRFGGGARALCIENNDYAKTQCADHGGCAHAVTMDTQNPFNVARSIANATCTEGDGRCLNDVERQILLYMDQNWGNKTNYASLLPVCFGGASVGANGICDYTGNTCTGTTDAGQQVAGEIVSESGVGCTYNVECKFRDSSKQQGFKWTLMYPVEGNCNGGGGGGGGNNPTPTPPPPQCTSIVAYKGGNALSAADLAALHVGDTITLAYAPGGSATKVRFQVNGGGWNETTTKNANSQFVWDYTLASSTSFSIEAQWFDGSWH